MQDESILIHREHVSDRPFDAVVAAFDAAVGAIDNEAFRSEVKASTNTEDFERRIGAFEGPSGFMCFMQIDHGAWLATIGISARAKLYILGNPLIARTMLRHDIGAGLNVPLRVMIYEDPQSGSSRLRSAVLFDGSAGQRAVARGGETSGRKADSPGRTSDWSKSVMSGMPGDRVPHIGHHCGLDAGPIHAYTINYDRRNQTRWAGVHRIGSPHVKPPYLGDL